MNINKLNGTETRSKLHEKDPGAAARKGGNSLVHHPLPVRSAGLKKNSQERGGGGGTHQNT